MTDETTHPSQDSIRQNIEAILRLEHAAMRQRTWADKIADGIAEFTGTIWFVVLHLAWFGVWVVINVGLVPFLQPFDPYPFQLLCMIVSLEAVLLATFVLIKQNRMGYLSDRREHLDLQINLLAEREVTRILRLSEQIARELGVPHAEVSRELAEDTQVESLMQTLDSKLNRES
jgi:uncharacterized membrane protein